MIKVGIGKFQISLVPSDNNRTELNKVIQKLIINNYFQKMSMHPLVITFTKVCLKDHLRRSYLFPRHVLIKKDEQPIYDFREHLYASPHAIQEILSGIWTIHRYKHNCTFKYQPREYITGELVLSFRSLGFYALCSNTIDTESMLGNEYAHNVLSEYKFLQHGIRSSFLCPFFQEIVVIL